MTYAEMNISQLINCKSDLEEHLKRDNIYPGMEEEYRKRINEINEEIKKRKHDKD